MKSRVRGSITDRKYVTFKKKLHPTLLNYKIMIFFTFYIHTILKNETYLHLSSEVSKNSKDESIVNISNNASECVAQTLNSNATHKNK